MWVWTSLSSTEQLHFAAAIPCCVFLLDLFRLCGFRVFAPFSLFSFRHDSKPIRQSPIHSTLIYMHSYMYICVYVLRMIRCTSRETMGKMRANWLANLLRRDELIACSLFSRTVSKGNMALLLPLFSSTHSQTMHLRAIRAINVYIRMCLYAAVCMCT